MHKYTFLTVKNLDIRNSRKRMRKDVKMTTEHRPRLLKVCEWYILFSEILSFAMRYGVFRHTESTFRTPEKALSRHERGFSAVPLCTCGNDVRRN